MLQLVSLHSKGIIGKGGVNQCGGAHSWCPGAARDRKQTSQEHRLDSGCRLVAQDGIRFHHLFVSTIYSPSVCLHRLFPASWHIDSQECGSAGGRAHDVSAWKRMMCLHGVTISKRMDDLLWQVGLKKRHNLEGIPYKMYSGKESRGLYPTQMAQEDK